jgi:hypothetical protein
MKSNTLKLRSIIRFALIAVFTFLMITCDSVDTSLGGNNGGNTGGNVGGNTDGNTNGNTDGNTDGGEGGPVGGIHGKTSTGTNLIVMDTDMLNLKLISIDNYPGYGTRPKFDDNIDNYPSYDGEYTLTFDDLEAKDIPATGDIICAAPSTPAPYGFLYKVKTVATEDGQTVITAEMASIEEAVDEAHVDVSFYADWDEGEEAELDEGVTVEYCDFDDEEDEIEAEYGYSANARSMMSIQRAASSTEKLDLGKKASKIDVDKDISANIKLTGSITLSAQVNAIIDCDDYTVHKFELSITPRVKADISASIKGKLEGEFRPKKPLFTKSLFPITFMAGPIPVVIVPEITVECVVTAEGEVELSVKQLVRWDYSYTCGVQYKNGGKLETFSRNTSKPGEYFKEPKITLSGNVTVGPKISMMLGLYGVAYAGMSVRPYAKLAGEVGLSETNIDTKLSFIAGLGLAVDAKLKVLTFKIGDLSKTFASPEFTIWEKTGGFVYDKDSWDHVINIIKSGGDNKRYTIQVIGNFAMPGVAYNTSYSSNYTFGSVTGLNVTITGNKTITLSGTGSLLRFGEKQAVVIRDTDFKGNSSNTVALIYANGADTSLTLQGNSSVSNNISSSINSNNPYSGGVYVSGTNAQLTLEGNSSVFNNTSSYQYASGGVYFNGGTGGTFIMKDSASVHDNTTTNPNPGNAGVVVSGGTFTMEGNSSIFNNTGGCGGGVYVNGTGITFTMKNNASVHNNSCSGSGGGVYFNGGTGGTFTMSGGTISDNKSSSNNGGGVYMNQGTFILSGGTISDNTVSGSGGGGGVSVSGTFNMTGGTISGNTTTGGGGSNTGYGGGVYVSGTFNMTGGTISGNTAGGYGLGGGVCFSGTFNMTGGTISGNTTNYSYYGGGGVYVGGTFNMTGGTISGNTAKGDGGGGVYVNGNSSTFRMETGTISGNTAKTGTALYKGNGTAERGTFSVPGDTTSTWTSKADLTTTDMLKVRNGDLVY